MGICALDIGFLVLWEKYIPPDKSFCQEYGWLNNHPIEDRIRFLEKDFKEKGYWDTGQLKRLTINAELHELDRCKEWYGK